MNCPIKTSVSYSHGTSWLHHSIQSVPDLHYPRAFGCVNPIPTSTLWCNLCIHTSFLYLCKNTPFISDSTIYWIEIWWFKSMSLLLFVYIRLPLLWSVLPVSCRQPSNGHAHAGSGGQVQYGHHLQGRCHIVRFNSTVQWDGRSVWGWLIHVW